jgi:glycosyltransferase involved in cell wall biosynthesis
MVQEHKMSLKADLEHHPLVSVIIPTFNSEKQLPICLESIKNQTYQNIEIIIADGFSTDKTVEIALHY